MSEIPTAKATPKLPRLTGRGFRLWRERAGLSKVAAARHLGVSRDTIYAWEATVGALPTYLAMAVVHLRDCRGLGKAVSA